MSPLRRAPPLVAALLVAALAPAMAQTLAQSGALDGKLRVIERALESGRAETRRLDDQATALTGEVAALRARAVVLARAVQDRESALDAIERRLRDLEDREAALAATETRRREAMAAALGGLLRIARRPPEAVLAMPLSLGEALHARMILAAAVPALDADARRLNDERATLSTTRARLADERIKQATAGAALTAERRDIDRLLSTKARLERRLLDEKHRRDAHLATLAAEARSLRDLVARLVAGAPPPPAGKPAKAEAPMIAAPTAGTRPAEPQLAAIPDTTPPPPRSFAAARGTLPLPARGRVVGHFGQTDTDGERAQGIRIATRPGAQVITPYDGRVVFAGLFRGLGLLLIIDHGEGYHSLLAGLSRIDPVVGQWLLAGEPVGVMDDAAGNTQVLYIELRRGGEAINPLPWLAASERKASG